MTTIRDVARQAGVSIASVSRVVNGHSDLTRTDLMMGSAWAINLAALWAADAIWAGVRIDGWKAYLIGSAVLGIANAVLKPLLTVLTLPLIIPAIAAGWMLAFTLSLDDVVFAEWIWAASKSVMSVLAILMVILGLGFGHSWLAIWVLPLGFIVGLTSVGSGTILTEALRAQQMLEEHYLPDLDRILVEDDGQGLVFGAYVAQIDHLDERDTV